MNPHTTNPKIVILTLTPKVTTSHLVSVNEVGMVARHTCKEIEDDDALKASFRDWTILFYITNNNNHAKFFQGRITKLMELETTPVSVFINTGQSNVFETERTEASQWSTAYLTGHLDPELAIQFARTEALGVPFTFSEQVGWSAQLMDQFKKLEIVVSGGRTITPLNSIKFFQLIWQRAWDYYPSVI